MYISAHRVQAPSQNGNPGPQGINAFYYSHGPYIWQGQPGASFLPETNPGVFVDSNIQVPPPGNRVRSFLDIVAPDGTPLSRLAECVAVPPTAASLPIVWALGNVWCRFGVELGLASEWRRELQRLFARAALLYREQEPA